MVRIRKLELSELPAMQQAQTEACYLYVLQEAAEPHFKIGIAGHPVRRLSGLQAGNRRKLSIVSVYAGSRAHCQYVEKFALKFFKATPGSEWVWVESLTEINEVLDAFCELEQ